MSDLINPVSRKKLINANSTLGNDDGAFLMRIKITNKTVPSKAIFGKKHIKFKHPPLQWEQKIEKIGL